MEITVYNPQKGRLETINATITKDNTTGFEDCVQDYDNYSITDLKGGLLIRELGYTYPFFISKYREPISDTISKGRKKSIACMNRSDGSLRETGPG